MAIAFSEDLFKEPDNKPLRYRLEDFFNRPDVTAQLTAAARIMMPHHTEKDMDLSIVRPGYPMGVCNLAVFLGGDTDGDPNNLCRGVITAVKAEQTVKAMDRTTRAGLDLVAKQMLTIASIDVSNGRLKKDILDFAKSQHLTYDKGVA